jgi:hypothetical protein
MDQRKKGAKPPFFINNPQGQETHKETRMINIGSQRPRQPPMQCWGCKGDHRFRDCPHRGEKGRVVHNVQKVETVEDMGRYVPRISTSLDKKQTEYQSHMIEVEGMINNQTIAILIDSGASHSYIDPRRKVNEMVKSCLMNMNGLNTKEDLNIFPLGSYECLIGMDWLEQHHTLLDSPNKEFTCLDEEGKLRKV